jgi:uncharacterized Ntn-hydrolase superfamily protein
MPSLRALGHFLVGLLLLAMPVRATWSILIIDLSTGEVAVGIATCLTGFDLRPETIVVVPGFGVAAAQSFVGPLSLRQLIRAGILDGTQANQILAQLAAADPGHQSRQYGIASIYGGTATFTGAGAGPWAGGLTGQIGSLVYTVQGNVLTGQPVNTAAEAAIRSTPGTLADKLMAAMEAAAAMGGDGRCSCNMSQPMACGSPPATFTKSAHIGLMIVSRPSDVDAPCGGGSGCGGGQYWLDLNVANQPATAVDPVVQLRSRFDTWRTQQQGRPDHFQSTVQLSGTTLRANGIDALTGTVTLRDAQGNPLGTSLPVTVGLSNRSTVSGLTFSPAVPQSNGTYTFTIRGNLDAGTAIVDVAVNDGLGRVGIAPQPFVTVTDAFGPCATGAIDNGSGGVLDALRVAGSAGSDRVTTVGLGQPFVLSLDPPVGVPLVPPVGAFVLWAHLGLPAPGVTLPFAPSGGALCFVPSPFSPAPTLVVADTLGLGGWTSATPAPWAIGFPGIPALLDVTLQAAMLVDAQGSVAASNALLVRTTALPLPTITSVVPSTATAGTPITVTGTNFLEGVQVGLGGVPVVPTSRTATQIAFVMPAGLSCDAQLAVQNLGGTPVTRLMNGTPVVTNMPYTSGPAAGGAFFVVSGSNLAGVTVRFNGVPMNVTNQSSAAIVGTTPPGTPGVATVDIRSQLGCFVTRQYTYQ